MAEELGFSALARTLESRRWKRTVVLVGFRRYLRRGILALVLLVLAVFLVLTDTVAMVVTLMVVAMIVFELCRRGIASDGPRNKADAGR